jgi:hypothetical protein
MNYKIATVLDTIFRDWLEASMFLEDPNFAAAGVVLTRTGHLETPKGSCPHGQERHPACPCYQHHDPAHTPAQCVRTLFEANSPDQVFGKK